MRGISTVDDVLEYLIAGARAVQIGTATFISPTTLPRLVRELEQELTRRGLPSVDALVGTVRTADDAIPLAEYV